MFRFLLPVAIARLLGSAVVSANDSSLHPLGQRIAPGEIKFSLREAAVSGERIGVELTFRPFRERDVKKQRSFHLFGGWGRNNSSDLITTQREEFHLVRQQVTAHGTTVEFAAPLRAPDAAHEAYQLAGVRLVGQRVRTLEFQRWFAEAPKLDPGFGLVCAPDGLRGTIRPSGLGARPLVGDLPLWPQLRTVDLEFAPVNPPHLQLWDSSLKHYWDGWRSSTPQKWLGGRSIVARHVSGPTVWRENETYEFLPSGSPDVARAVPPVDTLAGVALDVFWPEGDVLEIPGVRFDEPVEVLAQAVARLSPRFRELLAASVALRPGREMGSLAAGEWEELSAMVAKQDNVPVAVERNDGAGGKTVLRVRRRGLVEPWVFLFGAGYDDGRRVVLTALLVNPGRWTGPLPE